MSLLDTLMVTRQPVNPYDAAVQKAQTDYPWLRKIGPMMARSDPFYKARMWRGQQPTSLNITSSTPNSPPRTQ